MEVLRGMHFQSRDRNWNTYYTPVSDVEITRSLDSFEIAFETKFGDEFQSMSAKVSIRGSPDDTLIFAVAAIAESDFATNRTGLVVLHPLQGVAGRPVEIGRTDGTLEVRRFPDLIKPSQPFFAIRSMTHEAVPGVAVCVEMNGEKFETEDHRNWMDASFKTYSGSLKDPWPYVISKGESVEQSICVTIKGKPPARAAAAFNHGTAVLKVGEEAGDMPMFGCAMSDRSEDANTTNCELINRINPAYLVARMDGGSSSRSDTASAYKFISERTGIPLTLEIILPAKESAYADIAAIVSHLETIDLKPDAVVVTHAHDLKSFQPGRGTALGAVICGNGRCRPCGVS